MEHSFDKAFATKLELNEVVDYNCLRLVGKPTVNPNDAMPSKLCSFLHNLSP